MSQQQILWQPEARHIAAARITQFSQFVAERHGVEMLDYHDLQRWSVQAPAAFWQAVWDFTGVVGEPGTGPVLVDADKMPGASWFPQARLNFSENLLRYADLQPQRVAVSFANEAGQRKQLSFAQLLEQVELMTCVLEQMGVVVGDRVAGYLPNLPETLIAMLATARLGAIWSSCSPDFGVNAVCDRFGQIQPKVLIAAAACPYNGVSHDCSLNIHQISQRIDSIEHVIVIPYVAKDSSIEVAMSLPNSQLWGHCLQQAKDRAVPDYQRLPFDHPLYILFSSGTTGVPKCITHGAGGTLLQHLKEHQLHSDLGRDDNLFYFTTCGWMMWNWLVSALASGSTITLYDGSPFRPGPEALFDLVDELGITVLGTSAKSISGWEGVELKPRQSHDLSSLRAILSTGSPLLPDSFDYVYRDIKQDLCLSSISGGTDIVSCFALGCTVLPVYRGELQCTGLGMQVEIRNDAGEVVLNETGELTCSAPFPCMPVGFWNDTDGSRYQQAYFDKFPGIWSHGDFARINEHGGVIIYGRSDATLNPGGVRIGTAEIYRQVETLPEIAEALCIGQQWENDERIVLFVTMADDHSLTGDLKNRIRRTVRANTSPRHVPAKIIAVDDLPRTISGKLSEIAVRDVVHGREVKNTDALANPESLRLFQNLPDLQD
ncbi:MAG: acetoacetate--CoA ligase [Gammaproteobacteria bacterium]|jgi:acetoacetyl-CoA synthetase|nr:acetoacetate--CoA ligase [Gammaproteobacteria bacterium]